MASLKRVGVWDIQLGMVIVKCDKAGVPFNEYGRPLSNLGYIHSLHDYGVEYVYIWSTQDEVKETKDDKEEIIKSEDDKHEFTVRKEDDVNAVLLSAATEFVHMLKENFSESMATLKIGRSFDAPAVVNIVSDIIFMSNDNPEIFTKIALSEGMTKDEYTHGINVCINAITLGQAVGIEGKELQDLGLAGLLHDIGKVRIPEQILNKKSVLSEYEMASLKRHPEYAGQVLQRYDSIISEDVVNIIYQHHECCDGSGYPSGINAQYILKSAKVLAIAEAYNTMLMYSPEYPRAFNNTDAIKKIYAEAGRKYQADIVKTFITIMGVYPVGTAVSLNNGNIGIICEVNKNDQARPKVLMFNKENPKKVELVNLRNKPNIKIIKEINNSELNINPFELFNNFLQNRVSAQIHK